MNKAADLGIPVGVGSSLWLSTIPIKACGYLLSRHEFLDALRLRYSLWVDGLPAVCSCKEKASNSPSHTQSCLKGGWVEARHDHVRDTLIAALAQFAHPVREPHLRPVHPQDSFRYKTTNVQEEARTDLLVEGLFDPFRLTHVDVRGFNRGSPCYTNSPLSSLLKQQEDRKTREYAERLDVVELADFSPFIFNAAGQLSPRSHSLVRRIAQEISLKSGDPIHLVLSLFRTQLSFCILHGALRCLRGPRVSYVSSAHHWAMSAAYVQHVARIGADETL